MTRRPVALAFALLTLTTLLAVLAAHGAGAWAASSPPKGPVLAYEMKKPDLEVTITRRGNRIWRAGVGAPGACTDGEEWYSGFGLIGGIGFPIYPNETFHRARQNQDFSGRFEGDKVVGVFFETGFQVGGEGGEVIPPTCGNIVPRGRHQRFVARLVERNHHPV